MATAIVKPLFCALLNRVESAEFVYDKEKKEFIATWYGEPAEEGAERPIIHFVKFPKCAPEELQTLIDRHNTVNVPKVLAADLEAEQAEGDAILEAFAGL